MGLSNGKKMYTLILLVLGIGVGISSCRPKSIKTNTYIVHNSSSFLSDSTGDSSRYRFDSFTFRDSVFTECELMFEAITEVDFQNYKVNTRLDCQFDSVIHTGKNSFFWELVATKFVQTHLFFPNAIRNWCCRVITTVEFWARFSLQITNNFLSLRDTTAPIF